MGASGEREERGQSLVEMAIFLPVVILILVGIVEPGWT
jgi:Flp pilus assembly protein TadG